MEGEGESLALREVLRELAISARDLVAADVININLLSTDEPAFEVTVSEGRPGAATWRSGHRMPLAGSVGGRAAREARGIVVDDIAASTELSPEVREENRRLGLRSLAVVPLQVRGQTLGLLYAHYRRPRAVSPATLRLLEVYATSASLAIANARLREQSEALLGMAMQVARLRDPDQVIRAACVSVRQVLGSDVSRIGLLTADGAALEIRHVEGATSSRLSPPYRVPLEGSLAGLAVGRREVVAVDDLTGPRAPLLYLALPLEEEGLSRMVAAPLLAGEECLGVLYAAHRGPVPFTAEYRQVLAAIAAQVAVAVKNAQLDAQAHRQAERLLALYQVSLAVSQAEALGPALETILEAAVQLSRADAASVFLWREETQNLECVAASRKRSATLGSKRALGEGVTGTAFSRDEVVVANDDLQHPLATDAGRPAGLLSGMAIPLRYAGRRLGTLRLSSASDAEAFDDEDVRLLTLFAETASQAIGRAQLTAEREARAQQVRVERERRLRDDKLRAMGQLAGGIAHDLNQYLGLVAGHGDIALEALRAVPPDIVRVEEALEIMIGAAIDGGETVKRLETFARPAQDGPAERVNLGDLLREVAALTAPRWRDAAQAEGRPISLRVETEGDTTVLGWQSSLREALTNLVFNAIDALPHGGAIHLIARGDG